MQRPKTSAPSPNVFADSTASASTSGSGAASGGASGSGAAPTDLLRDGGAKLVAIPYDSITVKLPNGSSVGVFHFGANADQATDDQMVKSVEQLATALAVGTVSNSALPAAATVGSQGPDAPPSQGADAPPSEGTDAPSDTRSIDMIHVDLPNGTSIEIRHAATADETTSERQAVADQMMKVADELAAALKAYAGTSSNSASNGNSSGQLPSGLTA
jgi:hypothetical protein